MGNPVQKRGIEAGAKFGIIPLFCSKYLLIKINLLLRNAKNIHFQIVRYFHRTMPCLAMLYVLYHNMYAVMHGLIAFPCKTLDFKTRMREINREDSARLLENFHSSSDYTMQDRNSKLIICNA